MTILLIGAFVLWLLAGVVVGLLLGPRLRALPPRWSDAEFVRRAVDYDEMTQ